MSMYLDSTRSINDLAKQICENENVEKFVSGAAPTIVSGVISTATGSPIAGKVAGAVTSGLAKSESKPVAEFVTGAAIAAAAPIAAAVALPFVVVYIGWKAIFED